MESSAAIIFCLYPHKYLQWKQAPQQDYES